MKMQKKIKRIYYLPDIICKVYSQLFIKIVDYNLYLLK